jgi:DcaP outer membrane protein
MIFNHPQASQRLLIFLLPCLFLAMLGQVPVQAQDQPSQTPNMQQMQKKLELLEQEIQDLKSQMNAATKAAAAPAATPSAVVSTQTATPKPEEKPEKSGTGSTVDFYGFVMLDSGYQFGSNDPNWFDVMRPTKLPAFEGEFGPNGNTYWGVRQTRFGVKTFTPTALGNLKTIFEFELFGTGVDAGQTTFRLRQAYGELGHFGAGQYWSPFMDIDVFPNSLEYWGPNGMVFFRNVQVRWMPLQGDNSVTIALERPGASADQGTYSGHIELANVVPQFKWPDLSGNTRFTRKWGYVQLGAIVRKIAWVDTVPVPYNLSGTAIGWGVSVSSNLYFTKKDTGKFQLVYGDGVENYMNDAPVDVSIRNNFANTISPIKGVPLPVLGVVSFLDHTWSNRFTSSVGFSMLNIENSNGQLPSAFHQGYYALGNLLYHPLKRVTIGSEFQFGRRVNFQDGFNVNDYRVQFSFKYDWSKGFEF